MKKNITCSQLQKRTIMIRKGAICTIQHSFFNSADHSGRVGKVLHKVEREIEIEPNDSVSQFVTLMGDDGDSEEEKEPEVKFENICVFKLHYNGYLLWVPERLLRPATAEEKKHDKKDTNYWKNMDDERHTSTSNVKWVPCVRNAY